MRRYICCCYVLCFFLTGCVRTNQEIWEDTKTAGRYWNKGFHALLRGTKTPVKEKSYELSLETQGNQETVFIEKSGVITPVQVVTKDPSVKQIPGIEGFVTPCGERAAIFPSVHFQTDSYVIEGDIQLNALKKTASYLVAHPKTYIFIEGHTDERGPAAYNLALGSRRANAVRSYLLKQGVASEQIFVTSFGKEKPVAFGHNEMSWKKNRRAGFKLYEQ